MAYKDLLQLNGAFNAADFTEEDYKKLVKAGFSDEDIYNMSNDEINTNLILNSDIEIRTFADAKEAFDKTDVSGDLIIRDFAFHLLGGDTGRVNLNDIDELAKDLEPLFDKWVW